MKLKEKKRKEKKRWNSQDINMLVEKMILTIPSSSISEFENQKFIKDPGLSSSSKGLLCMLLKIHDIKIFKKLLLNMIEDEGSDRLIYSYTQLLNNGYLRSLNNTFCVQGYKNGDK